MKSPVSIKPTTCLVALGGGRTGDGTLNQISRSRLEHAVSVAQAERVEKIIAVGGYRANFRESSLIFDVSTAAIHRGFYRDAGLRDENIVLAECGFDTLTEALCVWSCIAKMNLDKLIVVTSENHWQRTYEIFQRLLGTSIEIVGALVHDGDAVDPDLEESFLTAIRAFFPVFPDDLSRLEIDNWRESHREFYERYERILTDFELTREGMENYNAVSS